MKTLELMLPRTSDNMEQNEEWLWFSNNGYGKKKIRLHDYGTIYNIPGLYETIFCDELKSQSWEVIPSMLSYEISKAGENGNDFRVLDFGAGNGMVAEALASQVECQSMIGVDILPEAKRAAERDRPGLYDRYYVVDMSQVEADTLKEMRGYRFNCLATVAALGFGDIPTEAFVQAFNLVCNQGWIAINIKDKFLGEQDNTGYSRLIRRMLNNDILDIQFEQKYRHRFSVDGKELFYYAIVGKKKRHIRFDDFHL